MKAFVVEDSVLLSARIGNDIRAVERVEVVATSNTPHDAIKAIDDLCRDIFVTASVKKGSGLDVLRYAQPTDCDPIPRARVLTNYDSPAYRSQCLAMRAAGFFDKSFEYQSFLKAMREVLGAQATR